MGRAFAIVAWLLAAAGCASTPQATDGWRDGRRAFEFSADLGASDCGDPAFGHRDDFGRQVGRYDLALLGCGKAVRGTVRFDPAFVRRYRPRVGEAEGVLRYDPVPEGYRTWTVAFDLELNPERAGRLGVLEVDVEGPPGTVRRFRRALASPGPWIPR